LLITLSVGLLTSPTVTKPGKLFGLSEEVNLLATRNPRFSISVCKDTLPAGKYEDICQGALLRKLPPQLDDAAKN
jgi:hypothetical protein